MSLPGAPAILALVGPRVTSLQPGVVAGLRIWGVRFWPDVVETVLGMPAARVRDWYGPLPAPAGAAFAGLAPALPDSRDAGVVVPALDRWAASVTAGLAEPDARIRAAVRAIVARRGEGAMAEVAREACLGLRHLQRLFPRATGLTLREYARVRRLREALAQKLSPESPGWSRIAASTGFADHAHLTREFMALAGVAPSAVAEALKRTAHHDVRP